MALVDLWKNNRTELSEKQIQQIIAVAGEGKLLDGNTTSLEIREFLGIVPSSKLHDYAHQCLEGSFDGSGLVLQDVVNEVGRRLGFTVEAGRYRGKPGEHGFDGLWELSNARKIVIEVKTTDAYSINLDTIAGYRKMLATTDPSGIGEISILLVVGRRDTGGLEAQIRGSRYAWDMRLISVDALLRLLDLKQALEDPATVGKIASLLMPQEFTKLDGIIDLVFSTAEEAAMPDDVAPESDDEEKTRSRKEPKFVPVNFHEACVDRVQNHLRVSLVKETRSIYRTPEGTLRVWAAASKQYGTAQAANYGFFFHPYQKDLLEQAEKPYCALGCGSCNKLFLIPFSDFDKILENTWQSERDGRKFWHIRVESRGGKHRIALKKGFKMDIDKYLLLST